MITGAESTGVLDMSEMTVLRERLRVVGRYEVSSALIKCCRWMLGYLKWDSRR